jgi:hypothetical protein
MRKGFLTVVLAGVMALSGCVALGWRFGPGFSSTDKALFSEPPVVVHRGEDYFVTWIQGSHPFFFQPDYKAMNGRLVFALVATSSSGSLAGRHQEMKIEGAANILALQHGGAYWWEREPEPDGRFVQLQIVEQSPQTNVVPPP